MPWFPPFRKLGTLALAAAVIALPAQVGAQDNGPIAVDPYAQVTFRVVQSDLDFDEDEEIDSSGFAVGGEIGLDFDLGETTGARVELEAGHFAFNDETRSDRSSYGGAVELRQELSDSVEMRVRLRRIENIGVLESSSADQTSAGLRLQWQEGKDRVRLYADYRAREYDLSTPAEGTGWNFAAQYNRRLGSYHWLRIDARHDVMNSDDSPRRSYQRSVVRLKYSRPIAKRLRLRPSIEYREWSYDDRVAVGDPRGDLRADSYVAPRIELAYSSTRGGFFAEANAEYRLRQSNDTRYDNDAIRLGLTLGYRF
ncbi:MAG: hypothetical protein HKO05_09780 [Erythrobacter sp.]|nr:hypothetical protein [Erythrobacter sp.]RZV36101.1 MAG: hypothetical protein EX262_00480 [Sphingomonadaceae bacterium]